MNEKDTKVDGTEVNPSQVECQQEENTLRGVLTHIGGNLNGWVGRG